MSFTGALGDVSFDNNGESEVAVNIFQIRNGTAELYTVISDKQCNETAIGRSPADKIPRIYSLQSAAITAALFTIEVVLIILTQERMTSFFIGAESPACTKNRTYLRTSSQFHDLRPHNAVLPS